MLPKRKTKRKKKWQQEEVLQGALVVTVMSTHHHNQTQVPWMHQSVTLVAVKQLKQIAIFAISCRWNRKRVLTQIGWSFFAYWVFSTVKSRIPLDECFSTCHLFLLFANWGWFCIRQKIMYLCYCRFWERYPWSFLSKAIHSIWVGCYNYIYADAESTYNMQKPRLLFLQKNAEKLETKASY